jgi:hypothetical protein
MRRHAVADTEGGGSKILRGVFVAIVIVALIILAAVFWRQGLDAMHTTWRYVVHRIPAQGGQRAAVLIYLVLAVLFGILFSRAGHFTAYGIAVALGALLWALFWEGFPLLGLRPSWTSSLGLKHLEPNKVILFAVLAAAIITVVFVPLELREKYLRRKHRLGESE